MSALNQIKPPWYKPGIKLPVIQKLSERYGHSWSDGVKRTGPIGSGHWIILHNRDGMRIRQILALYDTETEFLND